MISFCETPFSLLSYLTSERIFSGLFFTGKSGRQCLAIPFRHIKKVPPLRSDRFSGERAFSDGATAVCEALGT